MLVKLELFSEIENIFGGTHLYKLYGYGLCKGKPTPKIAGYKVQYLHFRYLKLLVGDEMVELTYAGSKVYVREPLHAPQKKGRIR